MNTFDFEYKTELGVNLIVEVDYYYEEPNHLSTESDWDYKGGLVVDGIRFYSGKDEVFDIDISPSDIALAFKKYMEEMELLYVMESNESF